MTERITDDYQAPADTVALVPDAIDFFYNQTVVGADVIGITVHDPDLGPFVIALSPAGAEHVAINLHAMASMKLDELRAEFQARREGTAK
jgi:hypothetical protein